MATAVDLQAAVDAVIAGQTKETDATAAVLAVLNTNTQMLRDLIAQGGIPDAVVAQLNSIIAVQEGNAQAMTDAALANTQSAPTP